MTEWKKNTVHPSRIGGYTAEGMGSSPAGGPGGLCPLHCPGELWRVRLEKVRPKWPGAGAWSCWSPPGAV